MTQMTLLEAKEYVKSLESEDLPSVEVIASEGMWVFKCTEGMKSGRILKGPNFVFMGNVFTKIKQ